MEKAEYGMPFQPMPGKPTKANVSKASTKMADTLYKYVGPERVDVLVNCAIRFSPASSFNDAFDVRPFFHELDSWPAASEAAYVLDHLQDGRRRRITTIDPGALLHLYCLGGSSYAPSSEAITHAAPSTILAGA